MATPRGMSHVALCASDFDRSLHFYRDLLGFKVAQEGTNVEGRGEEAGIYKVKNREVRFVTKTKEGMIRSAFAEDPDGILIQLDEMVPAK